MNFLTFIFALLLVFSFGTFVVLEKQSGGRKIRQTYLGHTIANRELLSKLESKTYNDLRSIPRESHGEHSAKTHVIDIPEINPDCSRLNIWPLIQDGKEKHSQLYDMTLKLLKAFYGKNLLKEKPGVFLNAFLKKTQDAVKNNQLALEKITLDPSFAATYYRMLKGTKNWNVDSANTYPSLLDVIKLDPNPSKICVCHAHKSQLVAIFGKKIGSSLFDEIHQGEGTIPTQEFIEQVYSKAHTINPDPELFDLLEMGIKNHKELRKTTLFATDTDSNISLRKNIYKRI